MTNPGGRADRDGVEVQRGAGGLRRAALLLAALGTLALAAALVVGRWPAPSDPDALDPSSSTRARDRGEPARAIVGDDVADGAHGSAAASPGLPPERATQVGGARVAAPRSMSDEALLAALRRAERRGTIEVGEPGEETGLAAFPPPGTDPPKPGIIVPDDFELPPGYVRHHQVTDDGRQLPAILMFHPDTAPLDASGKPIAIVPPELAPPGLPIETLEVPEPRVELLEPPGGRRVQQPPAP
jgi:hypothetical protein